MTANKCPYCQKKEYTFYGVTGCLNADIVLDEMIKYLMLGHPVKNLEMLREIAVDIVAGQNTQEIKYAENHGKMTQLVDFLLTHTIPSSGRHTKLFKNIAIWMVNNGMDDKTMKKLDEEIIANCPGRRKGEIYQWTKWASQERREVNWKELLDVAEVVDNA